ncbi:hypothetical protein LTR05_006534 [Lithohypha guttulata]|uniref:Uncharacterized protein n=1 Tax=Lithohypha guttulata TaxID=1690604 RepID=A0AAN7Y4U5_9EURO|nr:hypothetical protein LTR05_006534 [Lithohypha guttulata]
MARTDIASWHGLRGSQIQSKIVLEGGIMTNSTFSNGVWSGNAIAQHSYGVYYQIDLTKSFDATNQHTDEYMIPGLSQSSNTQAPNYIAGGLFQNDYQFYTFGGLADRLPIGLSTVTLFNVFPSNPSVSRFDQGVSPNQQTEGVSDNITSGAYASAPDQGLGFYFSGMVGAGRGALEYNSGDEDDNHPTITSSTFIKVDMTTPNDAKFEYLSWPTGLTPRAEGALVWLPYGSKGVLVAIGGVEVPGNLFLTPPKITEGGPFMTELAIYDIDADTWHIQQTLGTGEEPAQLASFCTAVVPTQDRRSHEIFVYGGYDGTYTSANPNVRDDVWVLSIPAFQWTKVKSAVNGNTHGRQGSVCFAPNPSTLITIGGTGESGGKLASDTIIDVLDLSMLEWTGKFDASSDVPFLLPAAIVTQLKYPSAAGPGENVQVTWLNSTLNDLFSTPYQGEVKTYYPFTSSTSSNNTGGAQVQSDPDDGWKTPVIATLCTVIPIAILATVLFFCFRKHRKDRQGVERTQCSRKNVFSWLSKSAHIDPEAEKSNSSGDTAIESNPDYFAQKAANATVHEAPSAVTSPGWNNAGTAAGSHERYEIMDQDRPDQRQSISTATARSPPFSPRSVSQDHVVPATAPSRFSEGFASPQQEPTRIAYELPNQRSEEDLSNCQNDVTGSSRGSHDERNTMAVSSVTSEQGLPSSELSTSSPSQTPGSPGRPGHRRNILSLSSEIPSLLAPELDEDMRRSRQIDILPEIPASPLSTDGGAKDEEQRQESA